MSPRSLQRSASRRGGRRDRCSRSSCVGVGVDVLVARHLHRSLDRTLRQRAVEVAQLSASAPALLTTPGALDSPVGGTQLIVEVVDRRGRIVARSLALGGRVLPLGGLVARGDRATARRAIETRRSATIAAARVRRRRSPTFGGPAAGGAVVVAASTHDLEETLASLRLVSCCWRRSWRRRSAARPVGAADARGAAAARRGSRDAAAEIERTGDPRRRLPEPAADDEVGRLATTLNAMLASLERAREAERRFLADASHELRTPLTALRGNVAYLARHGATPELVAELERDAERLARLADDLLALSREEAARRRPRSVRARRARAGGCGGDPTSRSCASSRCACGATVPRSSGRSPTSSRTRAGTAGGRRDHGRPSSEDGDWPSLSVSRRGAGTSARRGRRGPSSASGGAERGGRARASASRSCGRPRSATAAAPSPRAPASRSSCRLSEISQSPPATTDGETARERIAVKLLRTLSTPRLIVLARRASSRSSAVAAAVAVAASGGGGPTPPPKPLAQAIHDALAAPEAGRHHGAHHVHEQALPFRALLGGQAGSALMSGATGRLWVTNDGQRPARAAVGRRRRPDRLERRRR